MKKNQILHRKGAERGIIIACSLIFVLFISACGEESIDKKIEKLEEIVQKNSDDAQLYYQLATLYYEKSGPKNIQKAIDL